MARGAVSHATRTFHFTYAVQVKEIPASARHVAVWIPLPQTDRHQTVRQLSVESPVPYRIEREAEYGNSILHLDVGKALQDEPAGLGGVRSLPQELTLRFEAVVERRAYRGLPPAGNSSGDPGPTPRDLQPDRLAPIGGKIDSLARQVTRGARSPLEQARAIYDYVTSTLRYDKSGEGWGRGDALYACDVRHGNCTDFHSLIIALARARGIPARFVIGFPLPDDRKAGEVPGYHCWAELYVQGVGWLPVDSSEASKHPEKREAFFGGLDANRVQFTTGRDLKVATGASEPLNYFVYPYVEVDGKPYAAVDKSFSFTDVGS